jgi:hypothetical protein
MVNRRSEIFAAVHSGYKGVRFWYGNRGVPGMAENQKWSNCGQFTLERASMAVIMCLSLILEDVYWLLSCMNAQIGIRAERSGEIAARKDISHDDTWHQPRV